LGETKEQDAGWWRSPAVRGVVNPDHGPGTSVPGEISQSNCGTCSPRCACRAISGNKRTGIKSGAQGMPMFITFEFRLYQTTRPPGRQDSHKRRCESNPAIRWNCLDAKEKRPTCRPRTGAERIGGTQPPEGRTPAPEPDDWLTSGIRRPCAVRKHGIRVNARKKQTHL
jgi:hypothetical protein